MHRTPFTLGITSTFFPRNSASDGVSKPEVHITPEHDNKLSSIALSDINFFLIPFFIKLYSPDTWYPNTGILKLSLTNLIISK